MQNEIQQNLEGNGNLQAGRDIHSTQNIAYTGPISRMGKLIEKFKQEYANDIRFNSMVEKLQEYCDKVDSDGGIIGVEEKLNAGDFQAFVKFAIETKEKFAKKLAKYTHFESAQQIFVYILADVYSRFNNYIDPMIKRKASESEIKAAIQEKIIDPITSMLEENVLELCADEINGTLYFLTGNCHIKWI